MLTVTTVHPVNKLYSLTDRPFAQVELGEFGDYRVSGDHANGYYAIAPLFGCGRTCRDPVAAIRDLVYANGCTSLTVFHEEK